MHRLPKLKQLNVVFINQGRPFRQSFYLLFNSSSKCNRCADCAEKGRVMYYSVHQMFYHMFFSSSEYTEPDVVVIYGNGHEMPGDGKDGLHSEISYSNMTHSRDTVLVLMDATEDLVKEGVKAVDRNQSVDKLVSLAVNPLGGESTVRAEINCDKPILNERAYFSCLRRK